MPDTFQYKVKDNKTGKVVEGSLEAENAQLVVSKLRSMGYTPIEIQQTGRREPRTRAQDPGLLRSHQVEGSRGLLAAVRNDDQLRSVVAALARTSSRNRPRASRWPRS